MNPLKLPGSVAGSSHNIKAEDDEISLTSTIEEQENSDEEWNAEGVLAERVIKGEIRYLIEWTGYPLSAASWEPAAHLSKVLISNWEDDKKKHRRGETKPFRIRRWKEAVADKIRRKHQRHEQRNALRMAQGLDPTHWQTEMEEYIQDIYDYWLDLPQSGDDEDSSEEEEVDWDRLNNPKGPQQATPRGSGSVDRSRRAEEASTSSKSKSSEPRDPSPQKRQDEIGGSSRRKSTTGSRSTSPQKSHDTVVVPRRPESRSNESRASSPPSLQHEAQEPTSPQQTMKEIRVRIPLRSTNEPGSTSKGPASKVDSPKSKGGPGVSSPAKSINELGASASTKTTNRKNKPRPPSSTDGLEASSPKKPTSEKNDQGSPHLTNGLGAPTQKSTVEIASHSSQTSTNEAAARIPARPADEQGATTSKKFPAELINPRPPISTNGPGVLGKPASANEAGSHSIRMSTSRVGNEQTSANEPPALGVPKETNGSVSAAKSKETNPKLPPVDTSVSNAPSLPAKPSPVSVATPNTPSLPNKPSGPSSPSTNRPAAKVITPNTPRLPTKPSGPLSPLTNRPAPLPKKPNAVGQLLARPKAPSSEGSAAKVATKTPATVPKVTSTTKPPKAKGNPVTSRGSGNTAVDNVFVGGTTRKPRRGLVEAAADGKHEPKLVRARYANIIQKGSRDRENEAPRQVPKTLISLDSRSPGEAPQTRNETQSPIHLDQTEGYFGATTVQSPIAVATPVTEEPPTNTTSNDQQPPLDSTITKKKKRKSVHWGDAPLADESPNLASEASLFVQDDTAGHVSPMVQPPGSSPTTESTARPTISLRRVSTDDAQRPWSGPTDDISKSCLLGPSAARRIELLFANIPRQAAHPCIANFKSSSSLTFGHTCTAQDLHSQPILGPNQEQVVLKGNVSSTLDRDTLDVVADRLRLRSSGILYYDPSFCVLVFPSKCEDWKPEEEGIPPRDMPLKFIIFQPSPAFAKPDFAPAPSVPSTDKRDNEKPKLPPGFPRLPPGLVLFLTLDYNRLIPSRVRELPQHHVFLAFPNAAEEEAKFIGLWLTAASTAECIVYDTFNPGDWSRFVKAGSGTVIIHEDAIQKTRLFPNMSDLLKAGSYAFFVFQRVTGPPSLYPSGWYMKPVLGHIQLTRILPSGSVFLMTPGFMVSMPGQAATFVDWFTRRFMPPSATEAPAAEMVLRGKLVVHPKVCDWLKELTDEHSRRGSTDEVLAVQRLWNLLHGLGDPEEDEIDNLFIPTPETINANDEQSMVNWFGWWTVTSMDRYAKFYVLGSRTQDSALLDRRLGTVEFEKGTVGDVKMAYHTDDGLRAIEDQEGDGSGRSEPAKGTVLLRNDSIESLCEALKDLTSMARVQTNHVMVNFSPVAYWREDMPYHFADTSSYRLSYSRWFQFFKPLNRVKGDRNTYIGYFNTVAEWDPQNPKESAKKPKRPWIGIFRPVNVHLPKWTGSELLIWDPAYREKFKKQGKIYEAELIGAQRELLGHVNECNRHKNPGAPLERVWVGGFDCGGPYEHPMDKTIEALRNIIEDSYYWVPATREQLNTRGWRFVNEGSAAPPPPTTPAATASTGTVTESSTMAMDLDKEDEDDNNSEAMDIDDNRSDQSLVMDLEDDACPSILFHPPRPYVVGPKSGPSHIKNALFRWSEARVRSEVSSDVPYRFPPTKQWYGHQVREGSGYSHIVVDSWDQIFTDLGVTKE